MNTEQQAIHDKLDQLEAEIRSSIPEDMDKAKDLLEYFLDIVSLNFNKLTR